MIENRVMLADSYKYSHSSQYPENTVSMFDYMESRGGTYTETLWFGANYQLENYFSTPITKAEVDEAAEYAKMHGVPFDYDGWIYIVTELSGMLPVIIRAVPEGTIVPVGNVLLTVESTDSRVPWIAGWLETILLKIWYPTTVATKSYYMKQILLKYGPKEWAEFAYHNFGDRGSTSVESAAIGGMAHLVSFRGTDNFNALRYLKMYYNEFRGGFSVFATEHSTTTSHGTEGEEGFVVKMLEENPDRPIMSFVADSYDTYAFTDMATKPEGKVRNIIDARGDQTLVLRPDSGDPLIIIQGMLMIMSENNISTVPNDLVLFKNYRILWGDGITPEVIEKICQLAIHLGYSPMNFVFGSGGDIMQNVTRDTNRFAIKCSSITTATDTKEADGSYRQLLKEIDVFKDPITDPGKRSKRGRLTLVRESCEHTQGTGKLVTKRVTDVTKDDEDMLITIFENGVVMHQPYLEEIRSRVDG